MKFLDLFRRLLLGVLRTIVRLFMFASVLLLIAIGGTIYENGDRDGGFWHRMQTGVDNIAKELDKDDVDHVWTKQLPDLHKFEEYFDGEHHYHGEGVEIIAEHDDGAAVSHDQLNDTTTPPSSGNITSSESSFSNPTPPSATVTEAPNATRSVPNVRYMYPNGHEITIMERFKWPKWTKRRLTVYMDTPRVVYKNATIEAMEIWNNSNAVALTLTTNRDEADIFIYEDNTFSDGIYGFESAPEHPNALGVGGPVWAEGFNHIFEGRVTLSNEQLLRDDMSYRGIVLVIAHELGHAIGLHHVGDPDALMYELYNDYDDQTKSLNVTDIAHFKQVYEID